MTGSNRWKIIKVHSMEQLSDKEVVEKVLSGDKESYGILLDRYQNLVYRIALINFHNLEIAEDIVQETFLIGYKSLDRLMNPSAFAQWIAAISKNVCNGYRRKAKQIPLSLDYLDEVKIEAVNSTSDSDSDKEMIHNIKKIVQKLPVKYREIIELRYTEGFSCKRLADFLNLSMSAVLSRLYYARKIILKMLKKEGVL